MKAVSRNKQSESVQKFQIENEKFRFTTSSRSGNHTIVAQKV